MAEHNKLGKDGENAAVNYLQSNGYTIRHTNWRCGHLELDIIAETDQFIIIIEVKTRSSTRFILPQDAVTHAKIRHIVNAAQGYIHQYGIKKDVRFDIMALISGEYGGYSIDHIKDAFMSPVW